MVSTQDQGFTPLPALSNFTQPFDRSVGALGNPIDENPIIPGGLPEGQFPITGSGGGKVETGLGEGTGQGGQGSSGARFEGDIGDTSLAGGEIAQALKLVAAATQKRRRR